MSEHCHVSQEPRERDEDREGEEGEREVRGDKRRRGKGREKRRIKLFCLSFTCPLLTFNFFNVLIPVSSSVLSLLFFSSKISRFEYFLTSIRWNPASLRSNVVI